MTAKNQEVTFYTIGDNRYFLGVVTLLNSLRLTNNYSDLVVLDCGLTPTQRELLAPHCKLVEISNEQASNPTLFKPFPSQLHPTGIVALIDSDMIVTRLLAEIINLASIGKICVFPDPESDRWFAQWQQLFDLPNAPRHQIYANAGFVVFSTSHWSNLLEKWWQACQRILSHPTLAEGAANTEPSAQADQDALNALLMSEIPAHALAFQPPEEEVYRENLYEFKLVDVQKLECKYCDRMTTILHSNGSPKPWNHQSWRLVRRRDANMRLLMHRLLTGEDITLKVPVDMLPFWLRPGIVAQISIYALYAANPLISAIRKSYL